MSRVRAHQVRPTVINACAGLLLLMPLAILASWPAILNGFPILYDDSNVYVGFPKTLGAPYPPFYSAVVWTIGLIDLRAVIAVQAMIVVLMLAFAMTRFIPAPAPVIALAVAALLVLTQLPWLASWLTPDLLGGFGGLAVMLLTLPPKPAHPWASAVLLAVVAFACLAATANLLVLLPFALFCVAVRRLVAGSPDLGRAAWALLALLPLCAAISIAANYVISDNATLAKGSSARLFSKLADNRLAQPYLAEHCATDRIPACAHLSELESFDEAEQFLWGKDGAPSLARRLDAWDDRSGEYAQLSRRVILAYPGEAGHIAWRDTIILLRGLTFEKQSRELIPLAAPKGSVRGRIATRHPKMLPAFLDARQQQDTLRAIYPDRFYILSTLASYILLPLVLVVALIRRDRLLAAICIATLALLLGSAAVHGGLSSPVARYNIKVSWLPWWAVIVALLRWPYGQRVRPAGGR